jgi:hypothetical protein
MCVAGQMKYVPLMLQRAYRAAGLGVSMLKDNIEMDIKEMALMFTRTQYDQYTILRSQLSATIFDRKR